MIGEEAEPLWAIVLAGGEGARLRPLARRVCFEGSAEEPWAVRQAYSRMPEADFSRAILEPGPSVLAVSTLPHLTWSDLGTPRRVFDLLRRVPVRPPWLETADVIA
jgi:mannose-1-phosphate guanylyltransferase